MNEEMLVWLARIDWSAMAFAVHFVGLALTVIAALAGHAVAAVVLLQNGPRPRRRAIGFIYAACVVGLSLLWLSGGLLLVLSFTLDTMTDALIFKTSVVALLSINLGLVRELVLPLLLRRRRPVAAYLSVLETAGVALIAGLSIASWLALGLVIAVVEFARLPLELLFAYLAGGTGVLTLVCALAMVGVRLVAPSRVAKKRVARSEQPPPQEVLVEPDPELRHQHVPQVPPKPEFAEQLRQSLAAQKSNDNAQRRLRDRMQQERMRETRERTSHGSRAGKEPDDDDRLLRKWLSSGQTKRQDAVDHVQPTETEASQEPVDDLTVADVKRACRRAMIGAAAVSFVSNMLMLTGPLFMLQIYDRVLTSKSLPTLTVLFTLVLALFVFMGVLDLIRSRLMVRIGLRIDRLLGPQVFSRSIEVGDGAAQERRVQLHRDLQHIRQFVSGAGTTAIFDMPWAPVYFAIIAMFHWALGAVALGGALLLVVLSLANELLSRKPVAAAAKFSTDADQLFDVGRRNSELLQAMGMSARYQERWLERHSAGLLVTMRAADIAGLLSVVTKTARLVLQSAMLAMGAYLVLGNSISPGVMIAASIIMSRALAPVELAISHWRGFIGARQGMRRLAEEFSEPYQGRSRLSLPDPVAHLQVENVFAAPVGMRDPILKGLSFKLSPGDALGVLGPSGSGKSTLARVLVGVWPTLRGRVLLDGAPLDHWPPEQLGQSVGYLPQDAALFDGTVADNIARFDARAQPASIIAAAECANVHKLILGLSDGYNTRVGEGGAVLSGGQRQRIALARALYGQPALVVLDEPNSNLDSEGENALADAILTLRQAERAVIVMAHRHKALKHVNAILVLKDGRQAAFGPKDEIFRSARKSAPSRTQRSRLHAAE